MKKLFYNANVIDAVKENNKADALLIEADKILAVGKYKDLISLTERDTQITDVKGRTIIPGLIECHAHMLMNSMSVEDMLMTPKTLGFYRGIRNFENTLKMGITTVRDCGGCDPGIRMAIEEGIIKGPRLLTCGILTPTGGHNETYFPLGYSLDIEPGNTDSVYDGITGVQVGARKRIREGYDFVKITATGGINDPQTSPFSPEYTIDEIKAIVEISKMHGKDFVVAHCHGGEGLRYCLEGGIRSIEHGTWITKELMEMMAEKNAFYTPTFAIGYYMETRKKELNLPSYTLKKHNETKHMLEKSFQLALDKGVTVCMGTDATNGYMHGHNAMELVLMVENGMNPYEALLTATKNASRLLQMESEIGTLEAGKKADFVIVEDNPLSDFRILLEKENIKAVYKDGILV